MITYREKKKLVLTAMFCCFVWTIDSSPLPSGTRTTTINTITANSDLTVVRIDNVYIAVGVTVSHAFNVIFLSLILKNKTL